MIYKEEIEYLRYLAAALDMAHRSGSEKDEVEGERYITLSDTFARAASAKLRAIVEEIELGIPVEE